MQTGHCMNFVRATALAVMALWGGAFGPSQTHTSTGVASHAASLPALAFVEAPVIRGGPPESRFPQGSELAILEPGAGQPVLRKLTPHFFAVADPRVSFDGKTLLFSGQTSSGGRWQIWTVGVTSDRAQQLSHCPGDCLLPAFLPRGEIVYTSIQGSGVRRESELYVSDDDGAHAHPITFGPGDYEVEAVLRSGRLLISAKWPLLPGSYEAGDRSLYILRPDGSGLRSLRDDKTPGVRRASATELANGAILFIQKPKAGGERASGDLEWILPGHLHATAVAEMRGQFESATQASAGRLIVAERDSTGERRGFALYLIDPTRKAAPVLVYRNSQMSAVQPAVLAPYPAPLEYPSILHPQEATGRVLCLDAYLSQDFSGEHLPGRIVDVRVIALRRSGKREQVLGDAPVEKDGSFYATIPADMPVRFELIGPAGRILQAQQSWIWTRNGEDRACLGCHESHALAPPDHWPIVLRRFDMPIALGVTSTTRKPPQH